MPIWAKVFLIAAYPYPLTFSSLNGEYSFLGNVLIAYYRIPQLFLYLLLLFFSIQYWGREK